MRFSFRRFSGRRSNFSFFKIYSEKSIVVVVVVAVVDVVFKIYDYCFLNYYLANDLADINITIKISLDFRISPIFFLSLITI